MFGLATTKEFRFRDEATTECFHRLMYVVEQQRPFVQLRSPDRGGRTTLLKDVASAAKEAGASVISVNMSALEQTALLWHICGALSIAPGTEEAHSAIMASIRDEISGRAMCRIHTVIVLDDLHRAAADVSGLLRYLMSLNESCDARLTIVAGTGLSPAATDSFSELRIEVEILSDQEAASFIVERLRSLELDDSRLTEAGLQALVETGHGLMGRLNHVCELLAISATQSEDDGPIDADFVAALERNLVPTTNP